MPAFVRFVLETLVLGYVGVWMASVELLAMGAIILLPFLLLDLGQIIRLLCFATLTAASGFVALCVGARVVCCRTICCVVIRHGVILVVLIIAITKDVAGHCLQLLDGVRH